MGNDTQNPFVSEIDYRKHGVGKHVGGKIIVLCRHCQKSAVEIVVEDGKVLYLHKSWGGPTVMENSIYCPAGVSGGAKMS